MNGAYLRMRRGAGAWLVLACTLVGVSPSAQTGPAGTSILEWQVARRGTRVGGAADVVAIAGGPRGWIRSTAGFVDFTLRLEFRLVTPDTEGALLVRAWTDETDSWAKAGYRIALRATPSVREATGQLTGLSKPVGQSLALVPGEPVAVGQWQRLDVECRGDRVTVSLNGRVVQSGVGQEVPSGHIGLEILRGRLEIRGARVTPVVEDEPTGILRLDGRSALVVPPVLRREVKPRYTQDAMRLLVQGTVELEAVVLADGSVSRVWVTRSLVPDLDAEAVAAARRWQFAPATVKGAPTPVIITILMDFNLLARPSGARR